MVESYEKEAVKKGSGAFCASTGHRPQVGRGRSGKRLLTPFSLLASWLWCTWLASGSVADVVQVTATDGSGRTHAIEGTVLDYTGRQLTLQMASGRQRIVPTERVRNVQTGWNPQHQAGNQAWQQGAWQAAIAHYRVANQAEQRTWVRRQILTRLMRCYQAVGDLTAAGKLFLLVASSDPDTPAYQYIPLAWNTSGGVDPNQAESWLAESKVPPAMLLGASHLLSTPAHTRALRALAALREASGPRAQLATITPITTLATGQIWRAQVLEASAEEVQRWTRQVETFPQPLRAGPYFVLGVAYQRLQQFEQASLLYLRIPVLYGDQRHLAARALVAAARLQEQQNDRSTAITLLGEVVTRYKGTTEYEIAQRLLQDWEK